MKQCCENCKFLYREDGYSNYSNYTDVNITDINCLKSKNKAFPVDEHAKLVDTSVEKMMQFKCEEYRLGKELQVHLDDDSRITFLNSSTDPEILAAAYKTDKFSKEDLVAFVKKNGEDKFLNEPAFTELVPIFLESQF